MTTRELKISQLNHILSLVRETLKKEEELKDLRERANNLKHCINDINIKLKKPTVNESDPLLFVWRSELKQFVAELKDCKKQIKEAEDYITASNLLFEGFSQMFNYGLLNCYQNGGVLEVSELNEDFLYEYAYLIQNTTSLTIYRLLSMRPEVMKKVESIIKSEPTSRKRIRNYLKLVIKYDKLL